MTDQSTVDFTTISQEDLDHADSQGYTEKYPKGLSEKLIRQISKEKEDKANTEKVAKEKELEKKELEEKEKKEAQEKEEAAYAEE